MAPAATEPASLWRLAWAWEPGRLTQALRLALVCTLTVLVTETYATPEIALSAYIAFFVTQPERGSSLKKSLALTLMVGVVVALLLGLAQLLIDAPAWRVAAMALLSLGVLFLSSASRLGPVGATLALVLAYALDLLGAVPAAEVATRGLLYGWLFVAVPAAVSFVVQLLIGQPARARLQQALAERLRAAATAVAQDLAPVLSAEAAEAPADAARLLGWIKLARWERQLHPRDEGALRAAVHASDALLRLLALIATPAPPAPGAPQRLTVEARAALARLFEQMAAAFAAGGYPVELQDDVQTLRALAPSSVELAALCQLLADFDRPPPPDAPAAAGFWHEDAWSNPEHLRFALKTTAAAMACYLIYSLLSWPGIHTSMLSCYIVSLGTVAESVEKLRLRLLGCLAGAALGLASMLWIVPQMESLGALLALVFVGAALGAWLAAGSERIAYAGLQLAFAFFLCVLQGAGPGFDMVVARDRVLGVLLGIGVAHLVQTRCWPLSIRARIERRIAACQALLQRPAHDPALQQALAALRRDLALAPLEPRALRAAPAWIARRSAWLDAAQQLANAQALQALPGGAARCAAAQRRLEPLSAALLNASDPT